MTSPRIKTVFGFFFFFFFFFWFLVFGFGFGFGFFMDWQNVLKGVRELAYQNGLDEIYSNARSKVVSFAPPARSESALKRMNVYFTTSTVGICMQGPGETHAQVFRRGMSLEAIGALMASLMWPPAPAATRDPLPERDELAAQRARLETELACVDALLADLAKREAAKAAQVRQAKADETARIQQAEAAEAARVKQAEAKRRAVREAEEEEARRVRAEVQRRKRIERGDCGFGTVSSWRFVDNQDFENISAIATNGSATIALYDSGGSGFSCHLPKGLHNKLNGRQRTLPSPTCVALGSNGRYFIGFEDGSNEWIGSTAVDGAFENGMLIREIATFSFGDNDCAYFFVTQSGNYGYAGIPVGMRELMTSRNQKRDLKAATLGPDGEWFVSAQNGRSWCGGWTDDLRDAVRSVERQGGTVTFIEFGDDGTFIYRFSWKPCSAFAVTFMDKPVAQNIGHSFPANAFVDDHEMSSDDSSW
jgi:hypothetical protein